jgi:phospholipid/cholesterol/gamma-HCH transport system substrate-binding protein
MKSETKVGIMVTVAILFLLTGIFLVGNFSLRPGYTLNILFSFVSNIKVDARVLYAGGVPIGRVKQIMSDGELVRVVLNINPGVRIRRDAEITIYSQGLLGEKYVEINANLTPSGPQESEYLKPGETVRGNDPISSDATLVTLSRIASALRGVIGDPEMKDALIRTIRNAGRITENLNSLIESNKGSVNKTFQNLRESSETLQGLSKNLNVLLANLNELTSAKNKDDLQKAIQNLDKISRQLDQASSSAYSILNKIDRGEGSLGVLVNDKEMADDLRELVKDLKKNPWKILWKK